MGTVGIRISRNKCGDLLNPSFRDRGVRYVGEYSNPPSENAVCANGLPDRQNQYKIRGLGPGNN